VRPSVILSVLAGLLVALATAYLSFNFLKRPELALDWAALGFSGLTTGLITFFVVWGHFQSDPTVDVGGNPAVFVEDASCPKCGTQGRKYHPLWTIIGAVLLFPIGLILLFVTRRHCIACDFNYNARIRTRIDPPGVKE
jgi:hypothetical protein